MNALAETIAGQIAEHSLSITDGVLETKTLNQLRAEALTELAEGEFHAARIGKGLEKQRVTEVRGDKVKWLDKTVATASQRAYWELVDALRVYLHDYFRIHLERTEAHFAVYPTGAYYTRHLDQFQAESNRIFSIILYLNPYWKKGDGGELRVYKNDGSFEDIAPLHGRLILFRSDVVEHEVLQAHQQRISITGWIRRDRLIL